VDKINSEIRLVLSSQKLKSGQDQLGKKAGIFITKAEKWTKQYQKLKRNHQHHFNKGYNTKRNAKVSTKTSAKLALKTNLNMTKKINKCNLEHEYDDVYQEGSGLLTRR
jgi:hypothetical protein